MPAIVVVIVAAVSEVVDAAATLRIVLCHVFKAVHRLAGCTIVEPVGWVGQADVSVVAVGLNLEEPRQGIERGRQQDWKDESAGTDAILQAKERSAHHDVSKIMTLSLKRLVAQV